MARGDKNYDEKVRKVNKGEKSEKKIQAVHKMVESLIAGDSDAAAEHLHVYLQETTRALILGEKKDEEKEDEKDEKDEDEKDSDDKEEKDDDDKEEVKESSTNPHANLTKARGPEWAKENVNKGKIEGNSLRDKPKKSNDTKARGPEFAKGADKGKIHGDSLKKKPHKSNDTKARGPEFAKENVKKGEVKKFNDGRDRSMGTKD